MLDTVSKLLQFAIRNRFSGAVQFIAEIDCGADASQSVKLGLAIKLAVKSSAYLSGADLSGAYLRGAYLRGAYLRGADLSGADLSSADLSGADLSGAYLSGADLRGAYLSGADLRGAYLRGAYLRGADLGRQWIVQGSTRSDGYAFFLQKLTADTEPMVKAGCRYFTLREAQDHWEKTRAGTALLAETRAIIRSMVDCANARGLMADGKAV